MISLRTLLWQRIPIEAVGTEADTANVGDGLVRGLGPVNLTLIGVGGAIGSALASPAFAIGGWRLVSWIGIALPMLALAALATEFVGPPRR